MSNESEGSPAQVDESRRSIEKAHARARNVVLVATALEIHCPHCDAAQPAPGGSEFCETHEARQMCDGQVKPCVSCNAPLRMTWHDKVQVA